MKEVIAPHIVYMNADGSVKLESKWKVCAEMRGCKLTRGKKAGY